MNDSPQQDGWHTERRSQSMEEQPMKKRLRGADDRLQARGQNPTKHILDDCGSDHLLDLAKELVVFLPLHTQNPVAHHLEKAFHQRQTTRDHEIGLLILKIGEVLDSEPMKAWGTVARRYGLCISPRATQLFCSLALYAGVCGNKPTVTKLALEFDGSDTIQRLPSMPSVLDVASTGSIEQLKIILGSGKSYPLCFQHLRAVRGTSLEAFKLLVQSGVYQESRHSDFLDTVIRCSIEYVEPYLTAGTNIDDEDAGGTALHYAAKLGKLDVVSMLLLMGAWKYTPNGEGQSPLYLASEAGHENIVSLLLSTHRAAMGSALDSDYGANLTDNPSIASDDSEGEGTETLDEEEPSIPQIKMSPLHVAARNGHLSIVQCLMTSHDEDFRSVDEIGFPIHSAALGGHTEVVKYLVKYCRIFPAGVHVRNQNGATALHLAAGEGHVDTIKFLLRTLPVDINSLTCHRMETPLHRAIENGQQKVTQLLWNKGGDIHKRGCNGATALHIAVRSDVHSIGWLLKMGCRLEDVDNNGRTALCYAVQKSKWALVTSFIQNGADENHVCAGGLPEAHVDIYNRLVENIKEGWAI